jgi:hypothetical protein
MSAAGKATFDLPVENFSTSVLEQIELPLEANGY